MKPKAEHPSYIPLLAQVNSSASAITSCPVRFWASLTMACPTLASFSICYSFYINTTYFSSICRENWNPRQFRFHDEFWLVDFKSIRTSKKIDGTNHRGCITWYKACNLNLNIEYFFKIQNTNPQYNLITLRQHSFEIKA